MTTKRNKKVLQLPPENENPALHKADVFPDRVSIAELRKIWNDRNRQYTDDELYRIREWLYVFADVVVNVIESCEPETLQEICKRTRKKPSNNSMLLFTDEKVNAA